LVREPSALEESAIDHVGLLRDAKLCASLVPKAGTTNANYTSLLAPYRAIFEHLEQGIIRKYVGIPAEKASI